MQLKQPQWTGVKNSQSPTTSEGKPGQVRALLLKPAPTSMNTHNAPSRFTKNNP
jgi:hypothetical protein